MDGMTDRRIVDMSEAKQKLERKKYNTMVLDAFDRLTHQADREVQEKRAEVEREARNKL